MPGKPGLASRSSGGDGFEAPLNVYANDISPFRVEIRHTYRLSPPFDVGETGCDRGMRLARRSPGR
jgi:hypothetical protein